MNCDGNISGTEKTNFHSFVKTLFLVSRQGKFLKNVIAKIIKGHFILKTSLAWDLFFL